MPAGVSWAVPTDFADDREIIHAGFQLRGHVVVSSGTGQSLSSLAKLKLLI